MSFFHDTFGTPFGPFSVAVNESGDVVATAFGDSNALRQRLPDSTVTHRDPERLRETRMQLLAYFSGERSSFDLRLAARGTPFQLRVWSALQEIPSGETRTYGELAREIGRPSAARAVGRANATNPICVIVPCHRVIGADGSLTGFAFGEALKARLLAHERSFVLTGSAA